MQIKYIFKCFVIFLLISFNCDSATAQSNDSWQKSVEAQAILPTSGIIPFWFRSGQSGSVPITGASTAFLFDTRRNYDSTQVDGINWTAAFKLRANAGNKVNLSLIEGYFKAKTGIFEFTAGRTRDITGLVDTTLSSGAFSVSGNALGIPKLQLAMIDYYSIPIFDKLFGIKLDYQIGLLGNKDLTDASYVPSATTYFQENSIYVRLGKPHWRLKFFGGINHDVSSGNENKIFGEGWTLSPIQSLIYAAIGKTYHPPISATNFVSLTSKVGNQIGSVDAAFQYDFPTVRVMGYRQSLYDVGALAHLANIKDGINGLSITNTSDDQSCFASPSFSWHKILFEFIYTKDQAGLSTSAITNSSDEDYYNNYEYTEGWTYNGMNLGNPLLTSGQYTRSGLAIFPGDYFINNRVMAFHFGFEGAIKGYNILTKITYSKNYGTYGTSIEGHNLGYITTGYTPSASELFGEVKQFSGYLEVNKNVKYGLSVGGAIATDIGGLYYNSTGVIFKIKKFFN